MNVFDVLESVEQMSGKNEKIKILEQNKSDQLSDLLHAALRFDKKFHIKKFNIASCGDDNVDRHDEFMQLLTTLELRKKTGHSAIDAVESFFATLGRTQAKWYARVLRKDLQCGVNVSTANKAKYKIPVFELMLAKDAKKCKKIKEIVKSGGYMSPKLDGYRCMAENNTEDGLRSRNGTSYENFPTIVQTLQTLGDLDIVLDGEIMSDDFNSMQQTAFSSTSKKSVGDVTLYVFDVVPRNEWEARSFKSTTSERIVLKDKFKDTLAAAGITNIQVVDHIYVDSIEDAFAYEQQCIADGYEGAMFIPDIPYYVGRKSNKLMKFKTMMSMECEVVGIYEGINKYIGMMGGLNLRQENSRTCDCGSGFNDEQRQEFWNNPDQVVGRLVEIKYQELTPDGVMRFPIFKRFRDSGKDTEKK